MGIIWLIFGIVYAVRRPRIARLQSAQFPLVPASAFEEWQRLELRSIDILLVATWGMLLLKIALALLLMPLIATAPPDSGLETVAGVIDWTQIGVTLVGLVASAVIGSRAARLRKELGITVA